MKTKPWVATFSGHKCKDPLKQEFGWNLYVAGEEGTAPIATAWGSTMEEARTNAERIQIAITTTLS